MSIDVCEKFNDINQAEWKQKFRRNYFNYELGKIAREISLHAESVACIERMFEKASKKNCKEDSKKYFRDKFIPMVKKQSGSVLERSCFFKNPPSVREARMELLHYRCLRLLDSIFDTKEGFFRQWVDDAYDREILTGTEAVLILTLIKRSVRSLMKSGYDESRLSSFFDGSLSQEQAKLFAEKLIDLKSVFPVRDAEIVLFTEIVHALFKQPYCARRKRFKEFLNKFLEMLCIYNADYKNVRFFYAEQGIRENGKVPEITSLVKPVHRVKLEANLYWLLRVYDMAAEKSRTPFAAKVDELFDQGELTYKQANALLNLTELSYEWSSYNLMQQLMALQEKHRLKFDMKILVEPFRKSLSIEKRRGFY